MRWTPGRGAGRSERPATGAGVEVRGHRRRAIHDPESTHMDSRLRGYDGVGGGPAPVARQGFPPLPSRGPACAGMTCPPVTPAILPTTPAVIPAPPAVIPAEAGIQG